MKFIDIVLRFCFERNFIPFFSFFVVKIEDKHDSLGNSTVFIYRKISYYLEFFFFFFFPRRFLSFSCYCCYYYYYYQYFVVAYLAMRQEYLTTGFPIIIIIVVHYRSIEARTRTRKKTRRNLKERYAEREREKENCLRIFQVYKYLYTHYPSLCAVGFFCRRRRYTCKKRQRKRRFFLALYMFFGRIIELVYLILSSYKERIKRRRKNPKTTQQLQAALSL